MAKYIQRMRGQDYIDQTRNYLNYLEEHLNNVALAFDELTMACSDMYWVSGGDSTWNTFKTEVEYHDLSKFSKGEFIDYRKKFFPIHKPEQKNNGFDKAWENHKKENHHHHETAEDVYDIIHMIIDWTAMGYKFGDTAKEYYERNKDNIHLSENQIDFMYQIFDRIDKRREKERKEREEIKKEFLFKKEILG